MTVEYFNMNDIMKVDYIENDFKIEIKFYLNNS